MRKTAILAAFAAFAATPALATGHGGLGTVSLVAVTILAEAATPATEPSKPPEKMICRRRLETGSLVKATKICRSSVEWKRLNDAARRDAEDLQTPKGGLNPGN